jgi:hypothetical protein
MNRSDIMIESISCLDLIEKSNLSEEEKNKLSRTISAYANMLDSLWLLMLEYHEVCEKFNSDKSKYGVFATMFCMIRKQFAEAFKELEFFGTESKEEEK